VKSWRAISSDEIQTLLSILYRMEDLLWKMKFCIYNIVASV
jgi:hypothetical protein